MRRGQHSTNGDSTGKRSSIKPRTRYKKKNPNLWTKAMSFVLVGLLTITTLGSWGAFLSSESNEALAQEVTQAEDNTASTTVPVSVEGETPTLPEITLGGGGLLSLHSLTKTR